ncbi:MAG: hypothetical protein QOF85_2021 [Solirubrobacterales bacterium]|jgi:hypothetical protein|nr:hypothetical protein [Solirubrobacterales bacterium]
MSAETTSSPATATTGSSPDDANDLRGFHFKRLLGKTTTWIAIAVFVLAAGIAGAAFLSVVLGAAAAGAMFLLSLLIVFAIADSKAEDAFFEIYAGQHGLVLSGKGPLPPATPLLRKGDDRYAERALFGPLAEGVDGTLALYTYEDETTDSEGNRQTNYYRYTVGLVDVPECVDHIPELYCRRKSGLRSLEKFEDAFRSSERVKLESEALDARYEIFSGKEQDQVWLRRLFSPTFIVWLGEEAPKKFAFELVGGTLCCFVNGHKKSAADLDLVRIASVAVARRLREETKETGAASSASARPR